MIHLQPFDYGAVAFTVSAWLLMIAHMAQKWFRK